MPKKSRNTAAKLEYSNHNHTDENGAMEDYRPRTPFGKKLMELRKKIVASGVPLLSLEEVNRYVAELRGEDE